MGKSNSFRVGSSGLQAPGPLSSSATAPVSRSTIVPRKPADAFRAVAGLGNVRKTRTMKCTVMGGLLQPCLVGWYEDRLCPGLCE